MYDRLALVDEVELVVEEERAHERQRLELVERDGLLEELPLARVRKELEYELVRVGQEVVLVVLVLDLVLGRYTRCCCCCYWWCSRCCLINNNNKSHK